MDLVVKLARENPRWCYVRIVGEARKLSVVLSATSVQSILRCHYLEPRRTGGPGRVAFGAGFPRHPDRFTRMP